MKKLLVLKMIAFCLLLFAGASMANAQNGEGNNGQVARQTPRSQDEQKQDYLNNNQQVNTELQKKQDLQAARGYMDIPGFTFTGNQAVDDANYATAKQQWVAANPQQYQALLNTQPAAPVDAANNVQCNVVPVTPPQN